MNKKILLCTWLVMLSLMMSAQQTSNSLPWIHTKNLKANNTANGEERIYFDNTGKVIQSQAKNITTDTTLVSQTIYDAYDRPAITTMSAPAGTGFEYRNNFVTDATGKPYDHTNFDDAKTDSPDAVGVQPGTLGWYYSSGNIKELRVPTTGYPYSRTDFYRDGTGNAKRTAGPGDAYKMGTNRDMSSYIAPVQNELNHYLQIRNKYFAEAELGAMPTSLAGKAFQSVAKDVNGKEQISITDQDGKVLMTALPGSELTVTHAVTIGGVVDYVYYSNNDYVGTALQSVSVNGGNIKIYTSSNGDPNGPWLQVYNGPAADIAGLGMIIYKPEIFKIESDVPFTINYDASGTTSTPVCRGCAAQLGKERASALYYFKVLADAPVQVSGSDYTLFDMKTEQPVTGFSGNGMLPKGYYKLVNNNNFYNVSLTYTNSYSDISYTFYNQLGQAVASIDPEGVSKLIANPNAYATKNDIPFLSTSEYNLRGQLIAATSSDGARSEFIYRRDGKLRFSQNAKQRPLGWFSYTNYDPWGRAIESGEYHPNGDVTFNGLKTNTAVLENKTLQGGLSAGTKVDWTRTTYDVEDNTHSLSGYTQTFVRGGVSTTEGPDSKTWYSYDEQGRSTWTIKRIRAMDNGNDKYFTEDYLYDSEGNLTKTIFQKNVSAETFVQYYEYDADERLSKAYTNTTDNAGTKILQAKLDYFLHGPVKRMEIGGNLQGIDYTYTLDGKLKAINHSKKGMDPGKDGMTGDHSGFLPDAFGEVLEYYDGDFTSNTLIGSNTSGSSGSAVYADLQVSSHDPQTTVYKATNSITFLPGFNSNGNSFSTQLGMPASGGTEDGSTPATNISIAINDGTPAQYGGQIRGMSWFSKKTAMAGVAETPNMYAYKYDNKYRFHTATWGGISNNAFSPQLGVNNETIPDQTGYDKHGNIKNLSRTDAAGTTVDNFQYNYTANTNRLESITQQTTGQTYASYQYDALGQLIAEVPGPAYGTAPAKYIDYNVSGLVTMVYSDAARSKKLVEYVYDEAGSRIKKISYNSTGGVIKTTFYIGDVIYEQNAGQALVQTEVPFSAGGRIGIYFRQSNAYRYEMQDHLGNVRAVLVKTNSGSTDYVVFRDYYPFGMEIGGRSYTDADGYRYGYQGQYAEKDPETGWNAFELRMYDSRVGRWLSIDPAGEFYSPYVAMGNDPANGVDPTGGFTDDPPAKELDNVTIRGYTNQWNRMNYRDWIQEWDFLGGKERGYEYYADILRNHHGTPKAWRFLNQVSDPNNVGYRERLQASKDEFQRVSGIIAKEAIIWFAGGEVVSLLSKGYKAYRAYRLLKATGVDKLTIEATTTAVEVGAAKAVHALAAETGSTALRKVGSVLESVDDVLTNPSLLQGQSYGYVRNMLSKSEGWVNSVMTKTRGADKGWVLRQVNSRGQETGRLIQYHPGSRRHFGGAPYWKVSNGANTFRFPAAN
ncbi:RHS repeat-associated core domain-containing protein [Niabella sp. CC-SYL272]|uniref:RHS repeat domain-containing protein n=1 Tax=Niabella agricola TaxID=2891571 RepID=UPI001F18DCEC|nr:RHS repeat-associated core domain-containing protein [Niabella agricola]MCF3107875.1 RHS repeat-associated core domain-containing protein [Niabella agricola]